MISSCEIKIFFPKKIFKIIKKHNHFRNLKKEYIIKSYNFTHKAFDFEIDSTLENKKNYVYLPFLPLYFFIRKEDLLKKIIIISSKTQLKYFFFTKRILFYKILWEKFRLGSDVESPTMRKYLLKYFEKIPFISISTWLKIIHEMLIFKPQKEIQFLSFQEFENMILFL